MAHIPHSFDLHVLPYLYNIWRDSFPNGVPGVRESVPYLYNTACDALPSVAEVRAADLQAVFCDAPGPSSPYLEGALRVGALAAAGYAAYRACHWWWLLETADQAISHSDERRSRVWTAWLTGRQLEQEAFYPVEVAGEADGVVWTTTSSGLVRTDAHLGATTTQPLDVLQGLVALHGTVWQLAATRDGMYVKYTLAPRSWREWKDAQACGDVRSSVKGEWASRSELTGDGLVHSHARVGTTRSALLKGDAEVAVRAALQVNGAKTQAYSVGTVLRSVDNSTWTDQEQCTLTAHILADKWAGGWRGKEVQNTRPPQALQRVEDSRDDIRDPYNPTGMVVGPEFTVRPDAAPMTGRSNDLVAIEDRLDSVRSALEFLPSVYGEYAREFALAVAGGEKIEPLSLDQVLESQTGPLQRVRNAASRAFVTIKEEIDIQVKAFLKKEQVANSGPVRNISTLPTEANLRLGTYCLSLSSFLKRKTRWYCAGVQPPEVARRIALLVEGQRAVAAADISKMDACKSVAITAEVCHRLAVTLCPEWAKDVTALHIAEATCSAKTASGEPYAAAGSQLSGSATTTLHNTIVNAWLSYCAFRVDGLSPADAYAVTDRGLFVGDDSVSLNGPSIEQVATALGYKIKLDVVREGGEVPFLSRFFPGVWQGELGSYQDPIRLARKLAISFGDPSQGQQQLALNKWLGLTQLDPAMTVYSVGYMALCRITGASGKTSDLETPWFIREAAKEGGAGWPQLVDADRYFEMRTGVPAERYCQWFLGLSSWSQFLTGPGFLIDHDGKPKRKTVDPTAAFTPPPEVQVAAPPPHSTAGRHPAVNEARRAQEAKVKLGARAIKAVTVEVRREQAVAKGKKKPAPAGTPAADPFSNMGEWKPRRVGKRSGDAQSV